MSKQALGRGLKALIPDPPGGRSGLLELAVDRIAPNPRQPRQRFNETDLDALAASIREHGVLQPLLVSDNGAGAFHLIAGERRWRAAKRAGLSVVPVVVREHLGEERELEIALVENIQRADLTPLEEARAFEHLRASLGLTQADIAQRVGVDRSTVANSLRLLRLEPEIQQLVEEGSLSGGHARSLLAFPEAERRVHWARRAVATGMSVRDLERAAGEGRPATSATTKAPPEPDPNLLAAEESLSLRLGVRVAITKQRRGGRIVINCADQDDLMRVFDLLMEGN
jgi:ParB family transcriptional regulator, chromosome partitioning protein